MDAAAELSGPAHFAVGGSALSLGRPAEGLHHLELAARLSRGAASLTVGTRPDVHATAWAAHAHWLLGHDADALASAERAITLARAIDHPYSLAVALAYGSITHQMRRDLPRLKATVGELGQLCERYGFAYYREWALILDGWSRGGEPGIDLARRGLSNLKSEGVCSPACRTGCRCSPTCSARNDRRSAARAILDAALAAAQERDDVWWLPEVMPMCAAYDSRPRPRDCTRPHGWRRPTAVPRFLRRASTTLRSGTLAPAPAAFSHSPDPGVQAPSAAVGCKRRRERRARTLRERPPSSFRCRRPSNAPTGGAP